MDLPLLIDARQLSELEPFRDVVIFDCRFDLMHPGQGRNSWLAAHIPGAVYAHLDDNLASKPGPDSGRHPLPNSRSFAAFLARSGWQPGMPVVAYDGQGGAFAARLWWLMKYYGQPCSILDGGINAWKAAQLPLEAGATEAPRRPFQPLRGNPGLVVNAEQVLDGLQTASISLLDARDADRFAGRNETIDSIAGHVPGAINHPFVGNLGADKTFRPETALRNEFASLLGKQDASSVVHMCGSGVTACHNLFAMERSGLKNSRLYAGSWSEWIRDPQRPVEPQTENP